EDMSLLAAGECAYGVASTVGEADGLQCFVAGTAVGDSRQGQATTHGGPAGGDDLTHGRGDGAARAEALGNVADTAPVAEPAQGCSVHAYLTAVEGHDAEHRPHEGRLPRAVGAQYRSGRSEERRGGKSDQG